MHILGLVKDDGSPLKNINIDYQLVTRPVKVKDIFQFPYVGNMLIL